MGFPVDARSDLYALGVIAYRMVSGCLPHVGSTPAELILLQGRIAVPLWDLLDPAEESKISKLFCALVGRLLSERPDVLVFQTPPLDKDVELTGPVTVRLWISSSAVDTDFTARLLDIHPPSEDYPSGYHMNLTDSIIRARYREGWEKAVLMEPGEVYEVQIELFPTSNLFKAGHRIRLDISSSNFPRLDVNPNTGEPMGRHTHTVVAHNTVYLDREHPSQVELPVIPLE